MQRSGPNVSVAARNHGRTRSVVQSPKIVPIASMRVAVLGALAIADSRSWDHKRTCSSHCPPFAWFAAGRPQRNRGVRRDDDAQVAEVPRLIEFAANRRRYRPAGNQRVRLRRGNPPAPADPRSARSPAHRSDDHSFAPLCRRSPALFRPRLNDRFQRPAMSAHASALASRRTRCCGYRLGDGGQLAHAIGR